MQFYGGDLYGALATQEPFDMILANPLYWPLANGLLFQSGGHDGERFTKRIIREGIGAIREKGRMALVTPIFNENEFFDRFAAWFPTKDEKLNPIMLEVKDFDVMIMVSNSLTPEQMNSTGILYGKGCTKRSEAGIRSGAIQGLIFIRRCAAREVVCGRRIKNEQPFLWHAIYVCGHQAKSNRVDCSDSENAQVRASILKLIEGFLLGASTFESAQVRASILKRIGNVFGKSQHVEL